MRVEIRLFGTEVMHLLLLKLLWGKGDMGREKKREREKGEEGKDKAKRTRGRKKGGRRRGRG